jgi:UDP-2-acetamido-2-deoxy-ribo-hexuluronate aminotransferase
MQREVAFFDAVALHAPIADELLAACERVHRHGQYLDGPEVAALETRLGAWVGGEAIACTSGTTALVMALMAAGVGAGDEVLLPAFTFAAPVEAVLLLGAVPVLVDIEPATYTLAVDATRDAIMPRTRAIIAVSLYGQPADMPALQALADTHGLILIEDAAQSFGATLHGTRSGAFGHIACTSFFPTKPLGGCGDGGALFTRDPGLGRALREIRNHGQSAKYVHARLGFNGRMDTMACAQLLVKLAHFEAQLARRRAIAAFYARALPEALQRPVVRPGAESAWALYTVRLESRDAFASALAQAGIRTAIHYPVPLHRQPAFAGRCRWTQLDATEAACAQVLSLPLHPALDDAALARVAEAAADALAVAA